MKNVCQKSNSSLIICILVAFFALMCGCATYSQSIKGVKSQVLSRNYGGAITTLDKLGLAKSEKDSLLYYLEKGTILHLLGDYAQSNDYFDKAENRVDELYTISISGQTLSMVTSDNIIDYSGEDFERVLINYYKALNYLAMGELDEALVECRKVDNKLNVYNSKYEKKNIYKEDAFIRYLIGVIYEADGEINDAFIAYRKALEIYDNDYGRNYKTGLPPYIPADLLRTAKYLGFIDEYEYYQKRFTGVKHISQKELDEKGEIVFIYNNGQVPYKIEEIVNIPLPKKGIVVKLSFPKYQIIPSQVKYAKIWIDNLSNENTQFFEDVSAIAVKNLDDRKARIYAKTLARATAKHLAAEEGAKKLSENTDTSIFFARLATQTLANVTEVADTRSWLTLPGNAQLARMAVPPGRYDIKVTFHAFNGAILEQTVFNDVEVKAKQKKFLVYRTFF